MAAARQPKAQGRLSFARVPPALVQPAFTAHAHVARPEPARAVVSTAPVIQGSQDSLQPHATKGLSARSSSRQVSGLDATTAEAQVRLEKSWETGSVSRSATARQRAEEALAAVSTDLLAAVAPSGALAQQRQRRGRSVSPAPQHMQQGVDVVPTTASTSKHDHASQQLPQGRRAHAAQASRAAAGITQLMDPAPHSLAQESSACAQQRCASASVQAEASSTPATTAAADQPANDSEDYVLVQYTKANGVHVCYRRPASNNRRKPLPDSSPSKGSAATGAVVPGGVAEQARRRGRPRQSEAPQGPTLPQPVAMLAPKLTLPPINTAHSLAAHATGTRAQSQRAACTAQPSTSQQSRSSHSRLQQRSGMVEHTAGSSNVSDTAVFSSTTAGSGRGSGRRRGAPVATARAARGSSSISNSSLNTKSSSSRLGVAVSSAAPATPRNAFAAPSIEASGSATEQGVLGKDEETKLATISRDFVSIQAVVTRVRGLLRREPDIHELAAILKTDARSLHDRMEVGKAARALLLQRNQGLLHTQASRMYHSIKNSRDAAGGLHGPGGTVSFQDLVEAGVQGLCHALLKYEPSAGYKLSTYAVPWIKTFMSRAVHEESSLVRLPTHWHERVAAITRARKQMQLSTGRLPTDAELAAQLKWPVTRVHAALQYANVAKQSQQASSLEASANDEDGSTLLETIDGTAEDLEGQLSAASLGVGQSGLASSDEALLAMDMQVLINEAVEALAQAELQELRAQQQAMQAQVMSKSQTRAAREASRDAAEATALDMLLGRTRTPSHPHHSASSSSSGGGGGGGSTQEEQGSPKVRVGRPNKSVAQMHNLTAAERDALEDPELIAARDAYILRTRLGLLAGDTSLLLPSAGAASGTQVQGTGGASAEPLPASVDFTLQSLGDKYRLSKERVRQIEGKMLKQLQSMPHGPGLQELASALAEVHASGPATRSVGGASKKT